MMLYTKERKTTKKRSYDYLHAALISEKLNKRRQKGRVSLSGKPKEKSFLMAENKNNDLNISKLYS